MDCSALERIAHTLPLVRACDVVRNGSLRMSTPFTYPNGDYIDVFLESSKGTLFRTLSLSDYGQTSLYLRSAQVQMEGTARKKEILLTILANLNVKMSNGDLFVDIEEPEPDDLTDAIFRLSQACLRISEFASHQRLRSTNPFRDDVEGFFEASGLSYIPDVKVTGRFKNSVPIDFEVFSKEKRSYVCVLASMSKTAAHTSATETFRKWYDIASTDNSSHSLVTVYDSKSTKLKDSDKQRLRDYSTLVAYPSDQEFLKAALAS